MKQFLITIILIASGVYKTYAYSDTLYLKQDSSLIVYFTQQPEHAFYEIKIIDTKKNILLYDMPGWAAQSFLIKKNNNLYHIAVKAFFPVFGKLDWEKFEFVRFVLHINGNHHSFYKSYNFANIPKLSDKQIMTILEDSENIGTNNYIEQNRDTLELIYGEYLTGQSYVRNIGFLALGILNGDTNCLKRFNEVCGQCTGGEGCFTYKGIQKELSYAENELWYRNRNKKVSRRCEMYLKRKKAP